MNIENIVGEVISSEEEIRSICKKMGEQITKDYEGKMPVMVGLLNGCNPFFSDLIKYVDLLIEVDYMKASSYHGDIHATTEVKITKDLDRPVSGKDVILVDDIIDTGETLKCVTEILKSKGAKSVECCVLFDKKEARSTGYTPKYVGTPIPKKFVVGYGLDFNEHYRNLPYVGALKDEIINSLNGDK